MKITEKTTNLNENEIRVLKAISINSDYNGGDFTYFKCLIKKIQTLKESQVKGYISQLVQKKYIYVDFESDMIYAGDPVNYLTEYEF